MSVYLLDTHVFVWLRAATERLNAVALAALSDPKSELLLSIASAVELFDKFGKGRETGVNRLLSGGRASFEGALAESGVSLLPISVSHAAATARLPQHHRDPFDRLIIAQAMIDGLTLVSHDAAFARYDGLRLFKV